MQGFTRLLENDCFSTLLHGILPRMADPKDQPAAPTYYRWPWFVLAAVVLAFLLAGIWMSREVRRTRQLRDAASTPVSRTNPPPPPRSPP